MEIENQGPPIPTGLKKVEEKEMAAKNSQSQQRQAQTNSGSANGAWILAIIIIATGTGFGGYFLGKNKAQNSSQNANLSQNSQTDLTQNNTSITNSQPRGTDYSFQNGITGNNNPAQNTNNNVSNNTISQNTKLGRGSILGAETQSSQNNQNNSASLNSNNGQAKNYVNNDLGFSLQIPDDWKAQNMGNGEVVFINSQGTRYSVQSYVVGNNGNINDLQAFLTQQPNIHAITATTFNVHPALAFQIDGIYQNGIAFLSNGHLYYLLGNNPQTTLSSFNTI
jgi:hypothetical protein